MTSDKRETVFVVVVFAVMAAVFTGLGAVGGYRYGMQEAARPVVFDGRVVCSKIEGGETVCSFTKRRTTDAD